MKALKLFLIPAFAFIISYCAAGQTASLDDELNRAKELAMKGNVAEASAVYTDLMGKYPHNRDAVQGWLMLNMKRTPTGEQDAILQLAELEKKFPENTAIIFWKTFIQAEYKQLDEALVNSEELVTIRPDDGLNWLMRGQILEASNSYDEAMMAYEKATLLDPKNADAWQNQAGLFAKTDNLEGAIGSYTKAIELAPNQPVFLYNRGCVYCRKGDIENALADLGKAIAMNPQFKDYAVKDEDFRQIWDNEDFRKLVAK